MASPRRPSARCFSICRDICQQDRPWFRERETFITPSYFLWSNISLPVAIKRTIVSLIGAFTTQMLDMFIRIPEIATWILWNYYIKNRMVWWFDRRKGARMAEVLLDLPRYLHTIVILLLHKCFSNNCNSNWCFYYTDDLHHESNSSSYYCGRRPGASLSTAISAKANISYWCFHHTDALHCCWNHRQHAWLTSSGSARHTRKSVAHTPKRVVHTQGASGTHQPTNRLFISLISYTSRRIPASASTNARAWKCAIWSYSEGW